MNFISRFLREKTYRVGGYILGVAVERISFCFTQYWVKIGAFLIATPTRKIWKNLSVDQKDQRRRSVWVGASRFFQNRSKKTKIHYTCQVCVYLRKLTQLNISSLFTKPF